MKILDYKIEGLTLAITNMEKMLSFYSKVFNMQFTEKKCMILSYMLQLGEV